uniref:Uncharacterized protein n=1 Tax=Ascaris lumbricoides TaxID=6252 RepID=A0A9J2PJ64_ASCLU
MQGKLPTFRCASFDVCAGLVRRFNCFGRADNVPSSLNNARLSMNILNVSFKCNSRNNIYLSRYCFESFTTLAANVVKFFSLTRLSKRSSVLLTFTESDIFLASNVLLELNTCKDGAEGLGACEGIAVERSNEKKCFKWLANVFR